MKEKEFKQWLKEYGFNDHVAGSRLSNVKRGIDHPFAAVRVREILKWKDSQGYINIMANLNSILEIGRAHV